MKIQLPTRRAGKKVQNGINWVLIAKTTVLILLLLASAWFFGSICERIQKEYLTTIIAGKDIIGFGINLIVATTLLCITIGMAVTLIRPIWITIIGLALAAPAMMIGWEFTPKAAIISLSFAVITIMYTSSVQRKLNNQITFSLHPLFDSQKLLMMALTAVMCACFAFGYYEDATKNNFSIPPSTRETINKFLLDSTKQAVEKQTPEVKKEIVNKAMETAQKQYDEMWNNLETQIKPQIQNVAIFIGVMLFFTIYAVMIILGLLILFILEIIFPLLKITRFTKFETEMRQVKKLTL
jgi:hypothetical protein